MPVAVRIQVVGVPGLQRRLAKVSPKKRPHIISNALLESAFLLQKNATEKQIIRGSQSVKGIQNKAHPSRVTSRTGTLRRSIAVSRRGLPRYIDVGSDLNYAPVHEFGGSFTIKRHNVVAHTRKVAFGRSVAPFTVPDYTRGPFTAHYPKRPYLQPAAEYVRRRIGRIFVKHLKRAAS